ncbi:MAG: SCO family protein [Gammaproteobacteria bacterium]
MPTLLCVCLAAVVAPVRAAPARERGAVIDAVDVVPRRGARVPAQLEVRRADGTTVSLASLLAAPRPRLLVPAWYDCPNLCGTVLENLARALGRSGLTAGTDFDVLVLSLDPEERPAQARAARAALAARHPGAADWHFLTAAPHVVEDVTAAIGYRYVYDAARDEYAHAAAVTVLDPAGRVQRQLYGVEFAPRQLRRVLVDGGDGTLGSLGERLLLYCYGYDATHGYTPSIERILALLGMLTLVLLGGGVLALRWREHVRADGARRG